MSYAKGNYSQLFYFVSHRRSSQQVSVSVSTYNDSIIHAVTFFRFRDEVSSGGNVTNSTLNISSEGQEVMDDDSHRATGDLYFVKTVCTVYTMQI